MSSQETILVIDDDENIQRLLSDQLQAIGYEVKLSGSGEEALEFVRHDVPDCVVLDIHLPGMDGFEVARLLRAEKATQGIPIVMLTIRGETASKVKGFSLLVNDYVSKPFEVEELLARIQVQLKLKNMEQMNLLREKQDALLDLVDGLADTLLNHLNVSLLQLQFIDKEYGAEFPKDLSQEFQNLGDWLSNTASVVQTLANQTSRVERADFYPVELSPLLVALPDRFPHVRFSYDFPPSLPLVMGSDALEVTFDAICENAAEAVADQSDTPVISVSASINQEENVVQVLFRDQGLGIQPKDLPKVFTPFFTTKGSRQAGLGLWGVYKTMEGLGGNVDVKSAPEKGTEITLTFLVAESAG